MQEFTVSLSINMQNDMFVYCTNNNINKPWLLSAKLPYPIDLTTNNTVSHIAAIELSLPNHWNNIGRDFDFYIYRVENREQNVLISVPKGYYKTYKKIQDYIGKVLPLVENKLEGVKLDSILGFKTSSQGKDYLALTPNYGVFFTNEAQEKLGLVRHQFENKSEKELRIPMADINIFKNNFALIINCPIVRPSVIEKGVHPILRIVPSRFPESGDMLVETFTPIFHEITINRLYEIEVSLTNKMFEPLEMPIGDAYLLCHLKFA